MLPEVDAALFCTRQVKSARAAASAGALCVESQTPSRAASGVEQAVLREGVRKERVAQVKAALAAGIYDVPASAVALKLVETMLFAGRRSKAAGWCGIGSG